MSYMVIGGTGFIGSHITRRLVKEGIDVVTLSPTGNPSRFLDVAEKVKVVKGSTTEIVDILDTIKKFDVKFIVYAAAEHPPWTPSNIVNTMLVGFANVLEAVRLMDVRRLVWTSSYAQMGPPELYSTPRVNEDAPVKPTMIHGPTYVVNEYMSNHCVEQYGLDILSLRIGVNFGPGRGRIGVLDFVVDLFEGPAAGKPTKITHGDTMVTWQYVKEAANVIWTGLHAKGFKHRVFNTCDEARSIFEVAGYVKELIPDAKLEIEPGVKTLRVPVDASRIKEELKYTPRYTIKAGVADYIKELRAAKH